MKKLIFAILSIVFCANIATAQMSISRIKFGIQASPTFSWLSTNDNKINNNGSNIGFKLGVIADYYFNENYAISTGLGFGFNNGGKLIHDIGGNFLTKSTLTDSRLNKDKYSLSDGVNIRYHINYLEIPFALKLRTQQFGYIRYFAEAPIITLGFLTKATGDIYEESGKYPASPFLKENIKADVGPLAISWGFGGGILYDISPSTAAIAGLYFQKGIFDVTKDGSAEKVLADGSVQAEKSKATLGNIVLRLGIIF
jgi:hypothetical protein